MQAYLTLNVSIKITAYLSLLHVKSENIFDLQIVQYGVANYEGLVILIDLNNVIFFFGSLYPLGIMEPFLPRHNDLSLASLSAVPHVSSIFFKSPSKGFLRVIFGLPCFLLPGGT